MNRIRDGRRAEQLLAEHLSQHGYEVLGRNVRLQRGELDLVARRDGRLWFVEVKSRSRADRGEPWRAVDRRKSRAMYAAAIEYVRREGFTGDFGFLVASVLPGPPAGLPKITVQPWPLPPPEELREEWG